MSVELGYVRHAGAPGGRHSPAARGGAHTCMHTCMCACMRICSRGGGTHRRLVHVCMHAHMHVCMHARMHVPRMHACAYAPCVHHVCTMYTYAPQREMLHSDTDLVSPAPPRASGCRLGRRCLYPVPCCLLLLCFARQHRRCSGQRVGIAE